MSFLDKLAQYTQETKSAQMGQAVEDMVGQAIMRRRSHERRWYDNNFFDDGYHFRMVSPKTGQVIDHVSRGAGYVERAIPRASRQIRGVSNLLFASEPYPVVYPRRIIKEDFMVQGQLDEQAFMQAQEQAKIVARKQGIWLSTEWEDEQHLFTKLLDMFMLAAKNSISYLQVYSDTDKQKIITEVFDAFDIITLGDARSLGAVPFITKTKSMDLAKIMTSPMFDEEKVEKLTPDNKYATSEIKDAYMRARYGTKVNTQGQESIIVKETFLKEYLSENNWEMAGNLSKETGAMEGKSKGDQIMRHVFSAGGVTLSDEYIDYDDYPFAEFRFEPGPLYQVPFIERFIPQNKSLDIIVTRLEKFVNSMVVGVYQGRKGENFQVSNMPGGQMIEYETTPLQQMQLTNPGNAPFEVINLLNKYIEEQGASTSVLGQIPQGVKAAGAIENLQQQEYANLKMGTLMLKRCIKGIAQLMLERADKDFLEPIEVTANENGKPDYFDVIGKRGIELSKKVGKKLPDGIIPLDRKAKVRIDIEAGLGLTMEGKKEAMKSIVQDLMMLLDKGFVSPDAMKQVIQKYLETYGYGSTEEFMEAMDDGVTAGQMSNNQIKQMQIAILQALKDAGAVGPEADKKLVTASKLGTLQSLQDAGLMDKMKGDPAGALSQKDRDDDLVKLYKDASGDIRRQIEEALGLTPATDENVAPSQADTASKLHGMIKGNKDSERADRELENQQNSVSEE